MKKLYTLLFLSLATSTFAQNTDETFGNVQYSTVGCLNCGSNTGTDNATYGMTIEDASILSTGQGDAYDGIFELIISDNVGDTAYTNLTTGSFMNIGNFYVNDPEKINGITATVGYYFVPENYLVAGIFKLANTSGTVRTISAKIHANLGSDGATQLDSSTTGGAVAVDADRFTITSDGGSTSPSDYSDPVNTFFRQGAGSNIASKAYYSTRPVVAEGKDNTGNSYGADDIVDSFYVSIPTNDYRYIVVFNRIDSMVSSAKAFVKANAMTEQVIIDSNYLGGFVPMNELVKIANWDFQSVVTATASTVDLSNTVNAFPNPSTGSVTMSMNNSMTGDFTLKVIDNVGMVKQSSVFNKNTTDMNVQLDLSSLNAGLYTVEIKQDNYIARTRISKF